MLKISLFKLNLLSSCFAAVPPERHHLFALHSPTAQLPMAQVEHQVTQLSFSEGLSLEGKQPQALPGTGDGGGGGAQQVNYMALCDLKHTMVEHTNKKCLPHSNKGRVSKCVYMKFV